MDDEGWVANVQALGEAWIASSGLPRGGVLFVLIVALGLGFAVLARAISTRLVRRGSRLIARMGAVPEGHSRLPKTVGNAVFWLVLLLTVMAASETLGLPVVARWLSEAASYVPRIVAAILIVSLGTLAARLARRLVISTARTANLPAAERLGKVTEVSLLVGVALVAVEQLGIEVSLLATVVLIVLAALLGGFALAFGLGGREWVANVLSAHYVGRLYQAGQRIRVGEVEGRVVRITETAVILESDEGQVAIPAQQFASTASTLLRGRRNDEEASS
jgi:hypothetical protein